MSSISLHRGGKGNRAPQYSSYLDFGSIHVALSVVICQLALETQVGCERWGTEAVLVCSLALLAAAENMSWSSLLQVFSFKQTTGPYPDHFTYTLMRVGVTCTSMTSRLWQCESHLYRRCLSQQIRSQGYSIPIHFHGNWSIQVFEVALKSQPWKCSHLHC